MAQIPDTFDFSAYLTLNRQPLRWANLRLTLAYPFLWLGSVISGCSLTLDFEDS